MNNKEILKAIQKQKPFIVWVDDKPYNKREAIENIIVENKELKEKTNKAINMLEKHIQYCEQEAKGSLNNEICNIALRFDKHLLQVLKGE